MISSSNFYGPTECENSVDTSIKNLMDRERECDVIISDYIIDNYRDHHLFYTVNHPKTYVIEELFIRVLKYLSIKTRDKITTPMELDVSYIPIYPSVYLHEKLKFEYPDFYWNKDICNTPSSILEYVSAYMHYCGRRILTCKTDKEVLPYVAKSLLIGKRNHVPTGAIGNQIEYGGISSGTNYNPDTRLLLVRGWYLPLSCYDEIKIYVDSIYLGNAVLGILRNDVYANFPQYREHRSGWNFEKRIALSLPLTITVKCLRNGSIIREDKMKLG